MCSTGGYPPAASAIGIYFLLLASVDANVQQATSRSDGPYGLQSWSHEPMFVDEPKWIVLSQRTPKQSSSEGEANDHFYVTRGRKRYLRSPRPLNVLDRRVRLLFEDDDEDSWSLRGKKGTLSGILENDPFWVNRGKRAVPTDGENRARFSNVEVYRGKRDVSSEAGDMPNQDPNWTNRYKEGDLTSALSNGDQFWINRGKKDLRPFSEGGDKFWVNRGKKNDLQAALNGVDKFWVNRGKKDDIQSLLSNGNDPFWVNRGKKSELHSMLNGGDPFWVNRGKKKERQSLLNNGDQFWVNGGKRTELQSVLSSNEPFWVNRGKKNELQSMLSGGDQFWVNRGKKDAFQGNSMEISEGQNTNIQGKAHAVGPTFKNYLSPGETLFWSDSGWNDRLKKDPLTTILKPDPFFVNRGKKYVDKSEGNINDTQSRDKQDESTKRLLWETPLLKDTWVDRSKKTNDRSENLDPFWVTRGKRMEMHNRPRRDVTESTTKPSMKSTLSPRRKRMAKSPRITSSYDKDYAYKKGSDVNSLLLWWKDKDKSAPGEMQDEEDILGMGSLVTRRLGENIARVEPFWVNRGKKDVGVDGGEFVVEVPEKRRNAVQSDVVGDLGALTQPGETFWVARG